jgi:protein transport protein SEC20
MWWLAWMPVRTLYRLFASVLGVASVSGAVTTTSAIVSDTQTSAIPTGTAATVSLEGENAPVMETPGSRRDKEEQDDNVVDQLGKMDSASAGHDNEAYEDYDGPRNPKKRTWEEDVTRKDEL